MWSLKENIFELFGSRVKLADQLKDENNKGFDQRFTELLAEELDDHQIDKLLNFVEYTSMPMSAIRNLIPYMEDGAGNIPEISDQERVIRKQLMYIEKICNIRCTELGLRVHLQLLNVELTTLTEHPVSSGFDSGIGFDNDERTFDQGCQDCNEYSLVITGPTPQVILTPELAQWMLNIQEFHRPVNSVIRSVTYNNFEIIGATTFPKLVDIQQI